MEERVVIERASAAGLPQKTIATLEMAQHARFKVETGVPVYFADPQSPWQRGSNQNTNGLLRQYWPNSADLRHLTQTECDDVGLRLNTRPRQTLAWKTPAQFLNTKRAPY